MKNPFKKDSRPKNVSEKTLNRRSFIALTGFSGLYVAGYGAWKWLYHAPVEKRQVTGGAKLPLRNALNRSESVFRKTFSHNHMAKTYPKSMAARRVRKNGIIGLVDDNFNKEQWSLTIEKKDGSKLNLSMEDIMALPQTEIVFDFKCIEGWDQISWWSGVRFSDFAERYKLLEETNLAYAGLVTPDKKYYVGIDMPAMMHPQTLLAYKVNNQLLPMVHGAPLRLIIPVKYGIKSLKRIDTIFFSNERPPDYWAERGYDYYSGL